MRVAIQERAERRCVVFHLFTPRLLLSLRIAGNLCVGKKWARVSAVVLQSTSKFGVLGSNAMARLNPAQARQRFLKSGRRAGRRVGEMATLRASVPTDPPHLRAPGNSVNSLRSHRSTTCSRHKPVGPDTSPEPPRQALSPASALLGAMFIRPATHPANTRYCSTAGRLGRAKGPRQGSGHLPCQAGRRAAEAR